jgi:hypothetical protein
LTKKTTFSLSAQIVSVLEFLNHALDSFWTLWGCFFSKPNPSTSGKGKRHSTRDKEQRRKPRESAATFVKSHRLMLEILGLPLAIATMAGFYLSYAPKLSVDASESVASYSPMGTTFFLFNGGALEIHDVVVSVTNLHLENNDATRGFQIMGLGEFTSIPDEAKAVILSPGHKMGLPYAPAFGFTAISNFTGGTLTIIVRYRPAYLCWRKTEIFPFEAVRTTSGSWIWKSVAR